MSDMSKFFIPIVSNFNSSRHNRIDTSSIPGFTSHYQYGTDVAHTKNDADDA
jgi:hypothetical protein